MLTPLGIEQTSGTRGLRSVRALSRHSFAAARSLSPPDTLLSGGRCHRTGEQSTWCSQQPHGAGMSEEPTTVAVQRFLDELAGDSPAEPVVRALLDRAVRRLHLLCTTLLHRSYPRLTQPPLNLQTDELLGAVVERLLKALREARPGNVRQFFALACKHMRWELNDIARRLDEQPSPVELSEGLMPPQSDSSLTGECRRMLEAINELPGDEREAFELVRVQGMSYSEAAKVLDVSPQTAKRWVTRSLRVLTERLSDLRPEDTFPDS
jgi:RNA polymerase sigma factor (sigma-70 family)